MEGVDIFGYVVVGGDYGSGVVFFGSVVDVMLDVCDLGVVKVNFVGELFGLFG